MAVEREVGERFRSRGSWQREGGGERVGGARCARDERTRKRAADERTIYIYIYIHRYTYIHIYYISVWRKGEYIGRDEGMDRGRERKWQEGIEERDGKRVRCAEAESNRGSRGAVNVDDDDDDDDHHHHDHHWYRH